MPLRLVYSLGGGGGVGIGGGLLLRVVAFICVGWGREGEEVIVGREAFRL